MWAGGERRQRYEPGGGCDLTPRRLRLWRDEWDSSKGSMKLLHEGPIEWPSSTRLSLASPSPRNASDLKHFHDFQAALRAPGSMLLDPALLLTQEHQNLPTLEMNCSLNVKFDPKTIKLIWDYEKMLPMENMH